MTRSVLVGDVGGTKVRLALASHGPGDVCLDKVSVYTDPALPDLESAIERFLTETGAAPETALFALAGPIDSEGAIRLTNRSWPKVVPASIQSRFGLENVTIVNDFAAMARAIPEITASDFEPVIDGERKTDKPILVTGPGTGMGVSTLVKSTSGGWRVLTSEGGHVAFAPRNVREAAIRDVIARQYKYVSVEMIVSGRWLMPVYQAVCEVTGTKPEDISAQAISDRADKDDPICVEVMRFRANALMGAVGDGALITGAQGGVVLTGGVAEGTIKWLRRTEAIERFQERGPMSPYLAQTPVSVLKHDEAPLIGAAALALEMDG